MQSGVKFDAVGLATYSWYYPPSWFYEYYARIQSSIGKSVWIEEDGYPSAPLPIPTPSWWSGWNSFSQTVQAQYYQFMLIEAYGSPNVIGYTITYPTDEQSDRGIPALGSTNDIFYNYGLVDLNNQPKLSYATWRDFILNSTTSGTISTDSSGISTFRGYSGNYSVSFPGSASQISVHVADNVPNIFVFQKSGTTFSRSVQLEAQMIEAKAQSEIEKANSLNVQSTDGKALLSQAQSNYTQAQSAYNSQNYQLSEQLSINAYRVASQAITVENTFRASVLTTVNQAKQWLAWSVAIGRQFDSSGTLNLLSQAIQWYNQSSYQNALTLASQVLNAMMLKMDGNGTGWAGISSVASKPQTSVRIPGTALKALYAVTDANNLYLRLTVYGAPNANASYIFQVGLPGQGVTYVIISRYHRVMLQDLLNKSSIAQGQLQNSWGSDVEVTVPLKALGNPSSMRLHVLSSISKGTVIDSFLGQASPIYPAAGFTSTTTSASTTTTSQETTSTVPEFPAATLSLLVLSLLLIVVVVVNRFSRFRPQGVSNNLTIDVTHVIGSPWWGDFLWVQAHEHVVD
jgi:hypothetical protein